MQEYVAGEEFELPEDHKYTKITFFPVIFMLRGEDQPDGSTKYHYEKKLMAEYRAAIVPGAPTPRMTFPVTNRVVGVEAYGRYADKTYNKNPIAKFIFKTLHELAMEELAQHNEAGHIVEFAPGSGEEE